MSTVISNAVADAFTQIRSGMASIEVGIDQVAKGVRVIMETHGPSTRELLQSEFPGVPGSFWRAIIAVAAGRLHPQIVATGCTGIRYLERLSLEDQERAIAKGIPVAVPGTADHRLIPAHLLTPAEIARAITDDGHLRTLDEQAAHDRAEADAIAERRQAYLESLRTEDAELPDEDVKAIVWRVEKDRVRVLSCPALITKADLRKLLRSLE